MQELGREMLGQSLSERGWTFEFDRARKRLGSCQINAKRITVSSHLSRRLSESEVEDTLRHEIAHAIDAERRGRTNHDQTWKAIAVQCGADPERTFLGDLPDDPSAPYVATCPSCHVSSDLYRQPVYPQRCRQCFADERPSYLRVTHRATGRVVWEGGLTSGAYGGDAGVEAVCGGCGVVHRRARMPKDRTACRECCKTHSGGRFDGRFELVYQSVLLRCKTAQKDFPSG